VSVFVASATLRGDSCCSRAAAQTAVSLHQIAVTKLYAGGALLSALGVAHGALVSGGNTVAPEACAAARPLVSRKTSVLRARRQSTSLYALT
jgi:hypothetical protein